MAELLAKSSNKITGFKVGQKVNSKVLELTKNSVVFDIGGKSEGIITKAVFDESREFIKTLKVGDLVSTTVIVSETPDGIVLLSLRQTASDSAWKRLEIAQRENEPILVTPRNVNDAGVSIDYDSLVGFIPSTQLSKKLSENLQDIIGKRLQVKVVDIDKSRNKIVLSEKAVSEADNIKLLDNALKQVKEGEIYEGIVKKITNFGIFVEIPVGINKKSFKVEGLVHISELSWEKIKNPYEKYNEGDKVRVKILAFRNDKLALSIKQAQKDPWQDVDQKYKAETKVKAKVLRHSDFGVFVQLEPGVEGLIHLTKIPPGTRLNEGDIADCYIEEVDSKNRKIALGLILKQKPVGYK